jgi:hypothetical protein
MYGLLSTEKYLGWLARDWRDVRKMREKESTEEAGDGPTGVGTKGAQSSCCHLLEGIQVRGDSQQQRELILWVSSSYPSSTTPAPVQRGQEWSP